MSTFLMPQTGMTTNLKHHHHCSTSLSPNLLVGCVHHGYRVTTSFPCPDASVKHILGHVSG